jgi:hypothetical protein
MNTSSVQHVSAIKDISSLNIEMIDRTPTMPNIEEGKEESKTVEETNPTNDNENIQDKIDVLINTL